MRKFRWLIALIVALCLALPLMACGDEEKEPFTVAFNDVEVVVTELSDAMPLYTASSTPDSVSFASANDKIATVDADGKITGIKAGTTTVTLTATYGEEEAKSTISVKVTPKDYTDFTASYAEQSSADAAVALSAATVKNGNVLTISVTPSVDKVLSLVTLKNYLRDGLTLSDKTLDVSLFTEENGVYSYDLICDARSETITVGAVVKDRIITTELATLEANDGTEELSENLYTYDAKNGGEYDVIVCGGGTSGVMAAIASGREGAKTLLIERSFTVGGMLTMGHAGITKFTEHCKDAKIYKKEVIDVLATDPEKVQVVRGLPREYVKRLIDKGAALGTHGEPGSYVFTDKCEAQWLLMDMLEEAGVEVLYDTVVCLANVNESNELKSIVVHNKEGFTELFAKTFIDATGDADLAMLSGVEFHLGASQADVAEGASKSVGFFHEFGVMYKVCGINYDDLFEFLEKTPERFNMQPFGIMELEDAKNSYYNGQMSIFEVLVNVAPIGEEEVIGRVQIYTLPNRDEAILLSLTDISRFSGDGTNARSISDGHKWLQYGARTLTQLLNERVKGFENAKTMAVPDVGIRETRHIVGAYKLTTEDVVSGRDFEDSIACGGHPVDIYPRPKWVEDMNFNHWRFHIPYRIMLPEKVDNLLVTGRCVSASRAASGGIRPTAQCMAMGEAAGVAAAMAASEKISPRKICIKKLRKKLVDKGAVI